MRRLEVAHLKMGLTQQRREVAVDLTEPGTCEKRRRLLQRIERLTGRTAIAGVGALRTALSA